MDLRKKDELIYFADPKSQVLHQVSTCVSLGISAPGMQGSQCSGIFLSSLCPLSTWPWDFRIQNKNLPDRYETSGDLLEKYQNGRECWLLLQPLLLPYKEETGL